jgi:hypothetical protein
VGPQRYSTELRELIIEGGPFKLLNYHTNQGDSTWQVFEPNWTPERCQRVGGPERKRATSGRKPASNLSGRAIVLRYGAHSPRLLVSSTGLDNLSACIGADEVTRL